MDVELALFVDELRLQEIEVEASRLGPPRPEEPGQRPASGEGRGRRGVSFSRSAGSPSKDLEDRRVGHPLDRPDDRGMELLADDPPPAPSISRTAETVRRGDPRPQTAEVVGQPLGEHRAGSGRGNKRWSPGRRPRRSRAVPGLDVMRHVGDMDAEEIMPVGQEADADGVVEVLGFLAVDGDGLPVAVIGPAGEVLGSRRRSARRPPRPGPRPGTRRPGRGAG